MPYMPAPWAEIAPLLTEKVIAKFQARIERPGNSECWLWTGQINQGGYGMFYVSGRRTGVLATRIAYYLANGAIDDGKYVCHTCDNPTCVRPGHLWLGTHRQNVQDMLQKGRAKFYGHDHPKRTAA